MLVMPPRPVRLTYLVTIASLAWSVSPWATLLVLLSTLDITLREKSTAT